VGVLDSITRQGTAWTRRAILAPAAGAVLYQGGPPTPGNSWAVPGSGYTPPIMPSNLPGPPRPANNRPATLRQRARFNSRDWWAWQIIKGGIVGGFVFSGGLILVGVAQSRPGLACLTILGVAAMLLGALILVIHLFAPWLLTWAVEVPANHYWRVENLKGTRTRGFLAPGLMAMQVKTNARIVPYVNFVVLQVIEIVHNVFETPQAPLNIEVLATVRFNPTEADPDAYDTLSQMTQRVQFEVEIRRQIQRTVRAHMRRIDPARQRSLQDTLRGLEAAIARDLGDMKALGLLPEAVSAYPHALATVPDDVRRMWDRGASTPHESELIRDLREMMQQFGLTFEQAVHYYNLLKRGFQPPESAASIPDTPPGTPPRAASGGPQSADMGETRMHHAEQTQYGQPPAGDETVFHTGTPPGDETVRTTTDDFRDIGTRASRTIRDPEDAPDPMDLRDPRRDQRRKPKNQ